VIPLHSPLGVRLRAINALVCLAELVKIGVRQCVAAPRIM